MRTADNIVPPYRDASSGKCAPQALPAVVACAVILAGCNAANIGGPGGPPGAPGPAATPPAVDILKEPAIVPPGAPAPAGMRLVADAPTLEAFDDPAAIATDDAYLPGHWLSSSGALVQDADGPSTKLMVRRFLGVGGPTLGGTAIAGASGTTGIAAGNLPDRYRLEVSAWEFHYHGHDPQHDPGVLAVIPYWRDLSHFAILSAQGGDAEFWIDDGQAPGEPWPPGNRLWAASLDPPLQVGSAITWDVDVDIPHQHMTVYVDGQRQADVTTPFLTPEAHQVALAANGDEVRFKGFRLWVPDASNAAGTGVPEASVSKPGRPSQATASVASVPPRKIPAPSV